MLVNPRRTFFSPGAYSCLSHATTLRLSQRISNARRKEAGSWSRLTGRGSE